METKLEKTIGKENWRIKLENKVENNNTLYCSLFIYILYPRDGAGPAGRRGEGERGGCGWGGGGGYPAHNIL